MKIYISYRAHDCWFVMHQVQQHLLQQFPGCVLYATTNCNATQFEAAVQHTDIFITMISPNWLNTQNEDNERLLFTEDDQVRKEIALAIQLKKTVIPVLIDGAKLPHAIQLPGVLQSLPQLNPVTLRTHNLQRSILHLIQHCKTILLSGNPYLCNTRKPKFRISRKGQLLQYYLISFLGVLLLATSHQPYPVALIFLIGAIIISSEVYAWWLALSFKMETIFNLDYNHRQTGAQLLFTWFSPFVAYVLLLISLMQHNHAAFTPETIVPAAIHETIVNKVSVSLLKE